MQIREEILNVVRWYKQLSPDYNDITNIMYARKKLAAYGVGLGVSVAKARGEWKLATTRYEVFRTQKQIQFYGKHKNLEKSKMYAKANTEEFLKKSIEAENNYYDLEYLFRSMKEVLSEMNQRISYLRDEYKQEQFYNSDNV